MSKKYDAKIKRMKNLQLSLILLCIILIVAYVLFVNRPETITYDYPDECGPMPGGGGISHSVKDEDSCSNACYAYCLSKEMEPAGFDFKLGIDIECNKCICRCRS